jgi:hypothetical protein
MFSDHHGYSLLFVLFIAGYKNWLGPSESEFGEPRKNSGKLVGNYSFHCRSAFG